MIRTACLLFLVLSTPVWAQSDAVLKVAREVLTDLQAQSFRTNREFCGDIVRTGSGAVIATRPTRGSPSTCDRPEISDNLEVLASYHTHAGFDEDFENEIPSLMDVTGDIEEGVDGFVATPGGRLWFIDGNAGKTRQICGPGCLPQDTDFKEDTEFPIRQSYTIEELEAREKE